jgi:hypothetical protein
VAQSSSRPSNQIDDRDGSDTAVPKSDKPKEELKAFKAGSLQGPTAVRRTKPSAQLHGHDTAAEHGDDSLEPVDESLSVGFPTIEALLEQKDKAYVLQRLSKVAQHLGDLKTSSPKENSAKERALLAVSKSSELIAFLYDVKEKMAHSIEAQASESGGKK